MNNAGLLLVACFGRGPRLMISADRDLLFVPPTGMCAVNFISFEQTSNENLIFIG